MGCSRARFFKHAVIIVISHNSVEGEGAQMRDTGGERADGKGWNSDRSKVQREPMRIMCGDMRL